MIPHGFYLKEQASIQLFQLEKEMRDPENIYASQSVPVDLTHLTKLKWENSSVEEGRLYYFDVDKGTAAQQCAMLCLLET